MRNCENMNWQLVISIYSRWFLAFNDVCVLIIFALFPVLEINHKSVLIYFQSKIRLLWLLFYIPLSREVDACVADDNDNHWEDENAHVNQ